MKPDPNLEIKKICNLPADPTSEDWEVGFVDGQLFANGGSYDLICAVATGDHEKVRSEICMVSDIEKRKRLTRIVERIIPIVARNV
jgi:hypothetical protein